MSFVKLSTALSILAILGSALTVSNAISKSKSTLIKRLLQDYNVDVAPQLHPSSSIPVDIKILNVYPSFDEHNLVLELPWQLIINWTDIRMTWNPNDNGGVAYVSDADAGLTPSKIWTPMIFSSNVGDPSVECSEIKIFSNGQVQCYSNFKMSTNNCLYYKGGRFGCHTQFNNWNFTDITCLRRKNGCLFIKNGTSDQIWKYITDRSYYTSNWVDIHDTVFWGQRYYMVRINPRSTPLYVPTVVVGCVVLLQWLVMLNYRERAFLNIALMCASFTILSMLHSMPTIKNGGEQNLLRLSSSVVILNCVAMVVHVVSTNFLHRLVSEAASTRLSQTLTRLKLSVCLPTMIKLPGGEADRWILLNVTIDRVFFALSLITFVILCAVWS